MAGRPHAPLRLTGHLVRPSAEVKQPGGPPGGLAADENLVGGRLVVVKVHTRILVATAVIGLIGAFGVQATSQAAPRTSRSSGVGQVRVPACRFGQLRMRNGPLVSEATQQHTRILVLRNVSQRRCGLDGRPVVGLLTSVRGRVLPFRYRDRGDQMLTSAAPHLVVLAPGGHAYFGINKNACVTGATATARYLTAGPLGQLKVRLGRTLDYCAAHDPGHVVDISPFERTVGAVLAAH